MPIIISYHYVLGSDSSADVWRTDCLCVADINECMLNPNICENGACENRLMGYRCVCNPGYQPDGTGTLCLGKACSCVGKHWSICVCSEVNLIPVYVLV